MFERRDDDFEEAPVRRVRTEMHGRGLPPPPVAPIVGIFGIVAGLVLGLNLAPGPRPLPGPTLSPAPSPIAVASPSAQPQPTLIADAPTYVPVPPASPPNDGLSLSQALAAFSQSGLGVPADDVVSARVIQLGDLVSSSWSAPAASQWVWALTLRLPGCVGLPSTGWEPARATPDNPGACGSPVETVVLDYHTGSPLAEYTLGG
jgi:hypothetical protein